MPGPPPLLSTVQISLKFGRLTLWPPVGVGVPLSWRGGSQHLAFHSSCQGCDRQLTANIAHPLMTGTFPKSESLLPQLTDTKLPLGCWLLKQWKLSHFLSLEKERNHTIWMACSDYAPAKGKASNGSLFEFVAVDYLFGIKISCNL